MCYQRARKWTLKFIETHRSWSTRLFLCPMSLLLTPPRGARGSWTSWAVTRIWELMEMGVCGRCIFAYFFLHVRKWFSWWHKKISQVCKLEFILYCSTPSSVITLSTFEFIIVLFHSRHSLMRRVNIYWVLLCVGERGHKWWKRKKALRWTVKL